MRFVVYNSEGRILRYGSCPAGQADAQAGVGESTLEPAGEVNDLTHYVAAGVVAERPDSSVSLAQSLNVVTLSGVDQGSFVVINGAATMVAAQDDTDGMMEITIPSSGTYVVSCDQFPQKEFRQTVGV